jgi:hypothetical protein
MISAAISILHRHLSSELVFVTESGSTALSETDWSSLVEVFFSNSIISGQ